MHRSYSIVERMPSVMTYPFRLVRDRFWRVNWAASYEVRYAAGVSVWMRWLVAALGVYVTVQRPYPLPMTSTPHTGCSLAC